MIDRVREQVLGYLLGALNGSETERVKALVETDSAYRRQWLDVRCELDGLDRTALECEPPPGLARRTCQFVFAVARRASSPLARRFAMSPHPALPSWVSRIRSLDATVAAVVVVLAALTILPAIHSSRLQARLTACQDNLRELGLSLVGYSQKHGDYFPSVPAEGKLAAAGIYAPMLLRDGFLTEPRRVVCPESPMAAQKDLHIPTVEEIQAAGDSEAAALRRQMGGSYGYCLGHLDHGVLVPTKNLCRTSFALVADAPSDQLPEHQSVNHGGCGQNVLFEDGHVEFAVTTQPCCGTDDIFANDDHLVAAGVHAEDSVIAPSGTAPIIFVTYR